VLFVDPDARRAQELANALPQSSVIAIVSSVHAAMGALRLRTPDLIVTEFELPDATCEEFIAHLHNSAATQHVLLMVVTARAAVPDKIAALRAGADDYLVRPVDPEQFVMHVQLLSRFRCQFHR
jgi:two-component system response regulator MprA